MSENIINYSLEELGSSIAKYRVTTGMTQAEVAEKLGIGNDAISRLERGKIDPSIGRLISIAEVLDCSMIDLLSENSRRFQDQTSQVLNLLMLLESDEERTDALNIFKEVIKFKLQK